ncbi:hypothetical protein C8Q73DRAFT_677368 [Cubamyces lactineus]|nr:hypothetical protein C8Q73DRAFT_677368 [Cubamyces lactineus]
MENGVSSRTAAMVARASATIAAVRALRAGDPAPEAPDGPEALEPSAELSDPHNYLMNVQFPTWIVPFGNRSKRVGDNVRKYVENANLPLMVLSTLLPRHHSHANHLWIKHEYRRQLEYMHLISKSKFTSHVTRFCSANLPSDFRGYMDVDVENGGGITIPAMGFTLSHPLTTVGRASNIAKVYQWVMGYPLATVNHLIHLVFPRSELYTLQDGVEHVDEDIIRWAVWARDEETITASEDVYEADSVMIMVQPPWVLAEKDLQSFVNLGAFPKLNHRDEHRDPMTSSERLWGKVWDLCRQKRAHWFVLTSYDHWAFGCFTRGAPLCLLRVMQEMMQRSSGWTHAYVSPVMSDYPGEPTIVQCLLFWFSNAVADLVEPEHAWQLPVMPEPIEDREEEIVHTMPDRNDDDDPISESEWTAHSAARSHTPSGVVSDDEDDARTVELQLTSDMPSNTFPGRHSDGTYGPVAGPSRRRLVTDNPNYGVSHPPSQRGHAAHNWEKVDDWYARLRSSGNLSSLSQPPPPPSIAPSATSITTVSTVSTVRDYCDLPMPDGTWMGY